MRNGLPRLLRQPVSYKFSRFTDQTSVSLPSSLYSSTLLIPIERAVMLDGRLFFLMYEKTS